MRYLRNSAVNETEVEGEFFLVEPGSNDIYYLNLLSSALWRLIEAPKTEAELLVVLCDAFPDMDDRQIAADLTQVLGDMMAQNLILGEGQD